MIQNEEEMKNSLKETMDKITKFWKKQINCLKKFQKKIIKQLKQRAQTVQGLKFEIKQEEKHKLREFWKLKNGINKQEVQMQA